MAMMGPAFFSPAHEPAATRPATPVLSSENPFSAPPWYLVTEGYQSTASVTDPVAAPDDLPAEQGDPADSPPPDFASAPPGFSGSISFEFAPARLSGRAVAISRDGLGGYSNPTRRETLGMSFLIGGLIANGRLDYRVAYGPSWHSDHYTFNVTADELRRDRVDPALAGAEYEMDRVQRETYRLQLGWNITERHRLDLLLDGAPESVRGSLRRSSLRLNPVTDPLIDVAPVPGGVPAGAADLGVQGRRRGQNERYALRYHGSLSARFSLDAQLLSARVIRTEFPDVSADRPLYDDFRRRQLFNTAQVLGVAPLVSPSQYYFGGLGLFDGGSGERLHEAKLSLTGAFSVVGRHEWKIGAAFDEMYYRENPLYSGPRDKQAPEFYLYQTPRSGAIDPDSYIRLRSGMVAQVGCYRPANPFATDFISACNRLRYNAIGGLFSPVPADTRSREWHLYMRDEWTIGRLKLNAGLRYTRAQIDSPTGYSLVSSRTGNPLVGNDGFPVGTHDPDIPLNDPATPGVTNPPRYLSGPGRFIGGAYRFPGEFAPRLSVSWDPRGDGKTRLFAHFARVIERVPGEIALHAFENELGLSRVSFGYPDLTAPTTPATTYGGIAATVIPGTRLGSHDDWLAGGVTMLPGGLQLSGSARQLRQRRILAITQRNPMESIANYFFDKLVYAGACQNCALGQTSLFPGYPAGNTPAADNPMARGPLSETLANPGENTDPALFGHPTRIVTSARLDLTLPATATRSWSAALHLEAARARGNYEGFYELENGFAPSEPASIFSYPISPLTRGEYEKGNLPVATPAAISLSFSRPVPGISGLTGSVRTLWRQGPLRTPRIASPFSNSQGEIPGLSPAYYNLDTDLNLWPDRRVLRDYAPAARGALGHGASRLDVDLRFDYRLSPGHDSLDLYLAMDNVFNHRPPISYDDDVEEPLGFSDPGAAGSADNFLLHDPAQSDPTIRIPNPAFTRMTAAQAPRLVRFGVKLSF